jgi:hypothetical protein
MELFQYHCIDTSALISMWREHYRPKNFPSVWRLMEQHIDRGELVAPREVYEELAQGNDDLLEFVKRKQNKLFKELDEEQSRFVFEVKAKFPKLSDYNKAVPDADPFVVALAMQKGWKVVTSESDKSPYKIPAACRFYRIPCLSPADFIQENRWEI